MIIPFLFAFVLWAFLYYVAQRKSLYPISKGFMALIAGFITLILHGLIFIQIAVVSTFCYRVEDVKVTANLEAVASGYTKSELEGRSFFLGSGYLRGTSTPCYYYMRRDENGGLSIKSIEYGNAQLFELPQGETPHVDDYYRYFHRKWSGWWIVVPPRQMEVPYSSHINVPKESITRRFEISI